MLGHQIGHPTTWHQRAGAYYNIDIAFKCQNKLEEAIEAYNKALFINPDNAEAVEASQNLAVQLLLITTNFGYNFDNNKVQVKSEAMWVKQKEFMWRRTAQRYTF